ncbi:Dabb family protein [Microbacterium sp. MM2322]|uniref:Dabb family protein n=1 Tax=Microbacterium sp. MM2322 TaxID=3157631 RepID=UPI0032D58ED1
MGYRHVVLFRIHHDVEENDVTGAIDQLRTLADLPGITKWEVARSLDERKGRIIIEEATFTDITAFTAFRTHPRHQRVAAHMATISDWWIGDHLT